MLPTLTTLFWVGLGSAIGAGLGLALVADFRMNAPHIKVSVVMPGHIGTGIRQNSLKVQAGTDSDELNAEQLVQTRSRLTSMGKDTSALSGKTFSIAPHPIIVAGSSGGSLRLRGSAGTTPRT